MRIIPKYIAILLLLIISIQTLHHVGFMAYFQLNRVDIVKTLCINKTRPELKCDGKCHLKSYTDFTENKSVNQNSEEREIPSLDFLKNFSSYYLLNQLFLFTDYKEEQSILDRYYFLGFFYQPFLGRNHCSFLFQPPITKI